MNQNTINDVKSEIEQNFEELFDKIFRYLRVRLPTNEDAEDLVAETFIKAWKYAHSYDAKQGTILMWLFGVARREIATYWKKHTVKQVDFEIVEPFLQDKGKHVACLNDELDLESLVLGLSDEQRAMVLRHYLDGITHAEIARSVGRTESGVRKIVSRAIRTMKNSVIPK